MRRFTKEELVQLEPAEMYFRTVIYSQYKRATGNKIDTLVADLYDKATGGKISRNFSCGICSFNMYKQVGEKYFEDKKYYEEQVETVEIVETEGLTSTVVETLEPQDVTETVSEEKEETENNEATDKDKTLPTVAETLTDEGKPNDSERKKQGNKRNAKAGKA